jgi:capsular polysaccharide biosynthesis protein
MRAEASKHTPVDESQGRGSVSEPTPSFPRIRKISAARQGIDTITRLRNTWLGRLYKIHLKRYVVVRRVAHWVWRNLYPLYIRLSHRRLSLRAVERLPLAKLGDFSRKNGMPTCKLADAALVETPPPNVFPVSDQRYLVALYDRYTFPEIFVATIHNATTYGGTNLVLADGEVICHDLYDFERDYTSEEFHGRTLIDPKSSRIRWLLRDLAPEPIPVAATFVDACAVNYAHWLTEVLPRIVLFCAEERFRGVPIVVNDGLHTNIMESLLLVAGAADEIITLPIGRALAVKELYLTSVVGYVPFEPRVNNLIDRSHGLFHPHALMMLRASLDYYTKNTEARLWPDKIFLRRNSDIRRLTNGAELEKVLISRGYVIVEPEKLTFLEQVKLFANAKVIIGPTGAAMANAVFCKRGTHVAILISKCKDLSYKYWVNMLDPLGIKFSYVLGDIVENRDHGVHGDFEVKTPYLVEFLEILEHD